MITRPQMVTRLSTNPAVHSWESHSATCWSQVRRPNHYITRPLLLLFCCTHLPCLSLSSLFYLSRINVSIIHWCHLTVH